MSTPAIPSARDYTPRKLAATGRPARALQALADLSALQPADAMISTAQLQAVFVDDALALGMASKFRKVVLLTLVEQGLIFEPKPSQWRISGEGIYMLVRINAAGAPAPAKAPPRAKVAPTGFGPIVRAANTSRIDGHYDKDECNFKHIREGALDFRDLPSRRGNVLVYRDGRQEPITHGQVAPQRPRPAQIDLHPVVAPANTQAANSPTLKKAKVRA